jgi:hypothetical protein
MAPSVARSRTGCATFETRHIGIEVIMTSPITIASLALAAAVFTVSARADTGRPSCVQAQRVDESTASLQPEPSDGLPGSYTRYLMLNGVRRETAITAAWAIDHPRPAGKADIAAPRERAPAMAARQQPD